jgi:hypothetical protein
LTRWFISGKDATNVNIFSAFANDSGIATQTQYLPCNFAILQDSTWSPHDIDGWVNRCKILIAQEYIKAE